MSSLSFRPLLLAASSLLAWPLLAAESGSSGSTSSASATSAAETAVPFDNSKGVQWVFEKAFTLKDLKVEALGAPKTREVIGLGTVTQFDGKSQGYLIPTNPLKGMARFTLEICFRPDDDGVMEQRFFHAQDAAGERVLMETRMHPDGTWSLDTHMRINRDDRLTLHDPAKTHDSNHWHWVALVYDGTTMRHYIDGKLELEGKVHFEPMGDGNCSVGVRQTKDFWFKGSVREVRITPAVLPAEKLQLLPTAHREEEMPASPTADVQSAESRSPLQEAATPATKP